MYRKDSEKGGGGLLAYFSSALPSKKRALPKTYKTLEAIAVEVKIRINDLLVLSIYRGPFLESPETFRVSQFLLYLKNG